MNKIVFEHYPASKLPEELRKGLEKDAMVRVVIEEEAKGEGRDPFPGFRILPKIERKPMTTGETLAAIRRIKAEDRPSVTAEEAVARIRRLRDEWDD
ncbi:hypothetical protein [Rhizobium leguminosarum]|uniref:Uncharacterized protein n=1 Tax=Rhizobium leguminosarum TaxID=384 RepID=A0A1B1CDW1_RHILE|nr:hypothetical protein [Rhizobium leguminosarum]ANP87894.1 hypothetical protein BA011_20615 [Rhizobium leguminosarum]